MRFYFADKNREIYINASDVIFFDAYEIRKIFDLMQEYEKDKDNQFKFTGIKFSHNGFEYYSNADVNFYDVNLPLEDEKLRNAFLFQFSGQKKLCVLTLNYHLKPSNKSITKKIAAKSFEPQRVHTIFKFDAFSSNDKLEKYKNYFNYILTEIENNKAEYAIDLEFLRKHYDRIIALTSEDDILYLPIKVIKQGKIKSIQINYTKGQNNRFYRFEGEESEFIKDDDFAEKLGLTKTLFYQLTNLDIVDRDFVIGLIEDLTVKEINVVNDLTGDKARINRIINGIEKIEVDDVANSNLVNIICNNTIQDFKSDYSPNENRINQLANNYPKLNGNREQLETIDKILSMKEKDIDVLLVQGPPGTGKTEIINALAKEFLKNKYKTLITSNVHIACDNIVERVRNDKEVIIKRYKKVGSGEELIVNQKDYVTNQVLAKFEIDELPIKSQDVFDKKNNEMLSYRSEIEKLDQEHKSYEYGLYSMYQYKIATIDKLKEQLSEKKHHYETLEGEYSQILKPIVEKYAKASPKDICQNLTSANENYLNQIIEYEKNNEDLNKILQKNEVNKAYYETYQAKYRKKLDQYKQTYDAINKIGVVQIKTIINSALKNVKQISSFDLPCDVTDINEIINIHAILKMANFKSNPKITPNIIQSLKLKPNLSQRLDVYYTDASQYIETIYQYQKLNFVNKFLIFCGATKNGVTYRDYKSAKLSLAEILSHLIKKDDENPINLIIQERFSEENFEKLSQRIENLTKEINSINSLLAMIQDDELKVANQLNENKQKIVDLKMLIEKNNHAITELQSVIKFQEQIEHEKTEIKDLEVDLKEKESDRDELEKNAEIIAAKKFEKSYLVSRAEFEAKIQNIKHTLDFIQSGRKIFVNQDNHVLYDYVNELVEIKKLNIDDPKLKSYFDGESLEFDQEFNLESENDNGVLISMTTSQVAKLFKYKNIVFDYAIVDEASKCGFEDLVVSLPYIKHLVLIGDYMQLDPFHTELKNEDKDWDELKKSSLSLLFKQVVDQNYQRGIQSFDVNSNVGVMKKQYRMNQGIFDLVSPIYQIHDGFEILDAKNKRGDDVLCLNIRAGEESGNKDTSYSNEKEADCIVAILNYIKEYRQNFPQIKTIGVIAGYSRQVKYIRKKIKGRIEGLQIGTIDRFQGKEYDLVLLSLVRTKALGFLREVRRLNVAFSRAKSHLVILGNLDEMRKFVWRKINGNLTPEAKEEQYVRSVLIPQLWELRKDCLSNDFAINEIKQMLGGNDD